MSKSLDNYIGLLDEPREMFGKTMSIPDTLITRYLQYGAFASMEAVTTMDNGLKDGSMHPRNAKVQTAMAIVERYHNKEAADNAFAEFEKMFVKKDVPDNIDLFEHESAEKEMGIIDIMVLTSLAKSKGEARRLIKQGGVSINGEKITDEQAKVDFSSERLLKVGKRRFLRVLFV
jgi:tyrosyl-tRNA synthetase